MLKYLRNFFFTLTVLMNCYAAILRAEDVKLENKATPQHCMKLGERDSKGGIPGPNGWEGLLDCCENLIRTEPIDICGKGYAGGFVYTCIACGDGKCDKAYENKCNCSNDCN